VSPADYTYIHICNLCSYRQGKTKLSNWIVLSFNNLELFLKIFDFLFEFLFHYTQWEYGFFYVLFKLFDKTVDHVGQLGVCPILHILCIYSRSQKSCYLMHGFISYIYYFYIECEWYKKIDRSRNCTGQSYYIAVKK